MTISAEAQSKLDHAGELLIRAAAVIGTLPAEEQESLNLLTEGAVPDFLKFAIEGVAANSQRIRESLKTHPPAGFLGIGVEPTNPGTVEALLEIRLVLTAEGRYAALKGGSQHDEREAAILAIVERALGGEKPHIQTQQQRGG